MTSLDLLCADAHRAPQALPLDGFVHHGWFGELGAALNDLHWFALLVRGGRLVTMMRFGSRH